MPLTDDFWKQRWEDNQTGWHRSSYHPALEKFCKDFSGQVFVPLCGASLDLKYLANLEATKKVIGVDLSSKALLQFFEEQNLTPEITDLGFAKKYSAGKYELYECSLFDENFQKIINGNNYIYDRASYIAINQEDRENYSNIMKESLIQNGKWVLVGLSYADPSPPPHVIDPDHVNTAEWLQKLSVKIVSEDQSSVKGKPATEYVWELRNV